MPDTVHADFFETRHPRPMVAFCQTIQALHAEGKRLYILASGEADALALDQELWTFEENSFVPHAFWRGGADAEEPVVIGTTLANPNGAGVLVLFGDLPADTLAEGVAPFRHVIDMVFQADDRQKAIARTRYAALQRLGTQMRFHPDPDPAQPSSRRP